MRLAAALALAATALPAAGATYQQRAETFSWVDANRHTQVAWTSASQCTGGGSSLDDDITAELPIGFDFEFGSAKYTTLRVMTNGRLQFNNRFCGYGTQTASPRTYPYPYPNANLTRTMRIYGADLIDGPGTRITHQTVGSAPNRRFVVTWDKAREWDSSGSQFTLQIVLEEGGDFVYQFGKSLNKSGGRAQIGWQLTTSDYDVVSHAGVDSLEGTAIRFYKPGSGASAGGFNAFDASTPSGSVAGFIQTRVAGQAFSLDLVALNPARAAVLTTFTGAVTLELLDARDNSGALDAASGCRSSWPPIHTVAGTPTFAAANLGRITVSGINVPGAWRNVRARVRWTPPSGAAVSGCSTDNFAIRPAAFSAPVASDADWRTSGTARTLSNASASGGAVHAAGRPFRVATTALNAAGTATSGYDGVPALVFAGCVLPAACAGASAASLSAVFATSAGVSVATDATYAEAGAFSAYVEDANFAAVDLSDGTPAAQRRIASPAATIGRFVPDRYLLTLANVPSFDPGQGSACTGQASWNFTWIGQPFAWAIAPAVTVTAQSAAGQPVQQYAGALFKLTASSIALAWTSNAPAAAPFSAAGQTVAVSASGAGQASVAFGSAATFAFARPATPVAPFNAAIGVTVDVADASESAFAGNGTIGSAAALAIGSAVAGIEFTGSNAAGANLQLYGRLQVGGAHGDSRAPLSLPWETQAWSGGAWYRNQRDGCTQPAAANVAMSNWSGALAACDVSVSSVTRATRGQGTIRLTAPAGARSGGVDVALRLGPAAGSVCVGGAPAASTSAGLAWLLGPWSSAPNHSSDPAGRASFGRMRGDTLLRRELF
jgi:hypothetical protein